MFLRYHPVNILFLCNECHSKFDDRCKDNNGAHIYLSKGQEKRIIKALKNRIKNIKRNIKKDEKYLSKYKHDINEFKKQKEIM